MNKNIFFFLPKVTVNEATIYYVRILQQAFTKAGFSIIESDKIIDIYRYKYIFVMSAKWSSIVRLLNPTAKIVTWYQGLGSEESLMLTGSRKKMYIWNFLEKISLETSWINIFVSSAMVDYYENKFTKVKNKFIMPCFNKKLNLASINQIEKYETPSFVYAGSLDKWQCVEETLYLYKKFEESFPNASITLLTKNRKEAEVYLKKFKINNFTIKFVPLEKLDHELGKYKYGFLIRQNHIVNNVATPTKMNSYVANGLIPIYTDVISDFNKNIQATSFIKLDSALSVEEQAKEIIGFESRFKFSLIEQLDEDIKNLFLNYYNEDIYIKDLTNLLIDLK